MPRTPRLARTTIVLIATLAIALSYRAVVQGQPGNDRLGFIVNCPGMCQAVATSVRDMGGMVTQEYENVEAIAVEVPASRAADMPAIPGAEAVWKDVLIRQPTPLAASSAALDAADAQVIGENDLAGFIGARPADYNFNNADLNDTAALGGA